MQVYVNQHDFFINNVRDKSYTEDTTLFVQCLVVYNMCLDSDHSWKVAPDPDATPPKTELGLADLFDEIKATVDTESQIVKAVFPNPPVVMQVFLQRVFAQSVSAFIGWQAGP